MMEFANFEIQAKFVTKEPMNELSWFSADSVSVMGTDGQEYVLETYAYDYFVEKLEDGCLRYEITKYQPDYKILNEMNNGRCLQWEPIRDGVWNEFWVEGDRTPEEPNSFGINDIKFEEVVLFMLDNNGREIAVHTLTEEQLRVLNTQMA